MVVELIKVRGEDGGDAGFAEAVFEHVWPDVGELVEIDVFAGPIFELGSHSHYDAHEFVDAVVAFA